MVLLAYKAVGFYSEFGNSTTKSATVQFISFLELLL